jgi:hypothetical protein
MTVLHQDKRKQVDQYHRYRNITEEQTTQEMKTCHQKKEHEEKIITKMKTIPLRIVA